MTWLILSQSFFFTAFAVAIGRLSAADVETGAQITSFLKALAMLGIVVGLATCLSIAAALYAISGLRQRWRDHCLDEADEAFDAEKKLLPDLTGGGEKFASSFGFVMPIIMPLIFVGIWLHIIQMLR